MLQNRRGHSPGANHDVRLDRHTYPILRSYRVRHSIGRRYYRTCVRQVDHYAAFPPSFRDGDKLVVLRRAASVSLRPSYAKGDGVHRPKLIFKTDSARPLRITKIGPIVLEERYVCERELTLLQDVYPDVDSASPLECEVSGVKGGGSLESALERGGPQTVDSISIEYTDSDKNQHRARFFLFKNPDRSIVWREDLPSDSGVQDLAELWHKLSLLRKAPKELIPAGERKLLGEEAAELEDQLRRILQENSDSYLRGEARADLSHPVSREIAYLPEGMPEPLPWWQLRLMSFRDRYLSYWERCVRRTLQGDLPLLPSDLDANQFIDVLYKHRQWLMAMREGVESIYPDDPTA